MIVTQALVLLLGGFTVGLIAGFALDRTGARPTPERRRGTTRSISQAARPPAPSRPRSPHTGGRWL